ncbi:protein TolR [candidate division LCP-89 bacterium B3_LCP]|uniref:Protein TolR n=1 Tax=candidate division LCP-89 bacterium B3_LCP TaxID=2012998 RepID=A0A532V5A6_UNCL8|nr:MAG: protein TolR [candidate division LCP-89 bacterium B3_LCP]
MNQVQFEQSRMADINVTPLVDVFLVLLIIFMISAPMLKSVYDISLPTSTRAQPRSQEGIEITLGKNGIYFIDASQVTKEDFTSAFRQIFSPENPRPVFVRADGELPYQEIVSALDILRKAGAVDVGLVTVPSGPK